MASTQLASNQQIQRWASALLTKQLQTLSLFARLPKPKTRWQRLLMWIKGEKPPVPPPVPVGSLIKVRVPPLYIRSTKEVQGAEQ